MPLLGPELSAHARRHHAVITTTSAAELGVAAHQLRLACRQGTLERVHPGVYRVAAAPRTWHQRVYVEVLAAGPGALASRRAAGALWRLDGCTRGVPDVATPRHLRARTTQARIHESKDLHLAQPTERDGIPCTGLVRTLVDLGAVVAPQRLQAAVDDAIRRGMCTWDDLAHALALHSRKGRNGVGPFRAIVEECYGSVIPDSNFNRLVERLLISSALPDPVVEHRVLDATGREIARVDLAYPEWYLALELDSRRHHLSTSAFEANPVRRNRLEVLGWTVLNYTWRHYTRTPMRIVDETAGVLMRAGWEPRTPAIWRQPPTLGLPA